LMAFPFDQSFKLVNEEDTIGTLKYVAGISLSSSAEVSSLDRELNLERLHADHLYRVRDRRKDCIHHFEALVSYHTGWEQPQIDHAVYVKLKFGLPVYSHLLLMHARGAPRSIPERIMRVSGGLRQTLRVNVIRLWQRPASEVLAAGRVALYPWTALMNATVEEQREAARRLKSSGREGLQMQMALLGTLRYGSREAFYERIGRMLLTKEILRESPLWQEIEREARAVGEAEGQAIGEAKGQSIGEAIGKAKGERHIVRVFLETRFGPLPEWVEQKLATAGTETLDLWAKRAAIAPSLSVVFE
jgi:predicted transposase YdaD